MKKCFIILLFLILSMGLFAVGKKDIPKNVKIIYQVAAQGSISTTVIDLDNNEIVIISFGPDGSFLGITRTGWIVNPSDYQVLSGNK